MTRLAPLPTAMEITFRVFLITLLDTIRCCRYPKKCFCSTKEGDSVRYCGGQDDSGEISGTEFELALQSMGIDITPTEARDLAAMADKNKVKEELEPWKSR